MSNQVWGFVGWFGGGMDQWVQGVNPHYMPRKAAASKGGRG